VEPDLNMDKIYLMARGVMVQIEESIDNMFNVPLLARCRDTLGWLDGQAQQLEGYPGTKQLIRAWLETVGRRLALAKGDASLGQDENTAAVPGDF
jgi:hypothetical protein